MKLAVAEKLPIKTLGWAALVARFDGMLLI
jgi:hypothetical protein